jgi:hypothetical protein
MALSINTPTNVVAVSVFNPDTGTASTAAVAAPVKGQVIRLLAALGAQTVGTADNTLTGKINGVAMVHDTWKQPTSGSAAGEIDWANASPLSPANYVQAGDSIQFTSDGAGSNVTPTMFTALIMQQ